MASRLDDLIREHAERLDQLAGPIDLTDVTSAARHDTTTVTLVDIEPTWNQPEGRHRWPVIAVAAAAVVAVVVGGLVIAASTDDPAGEVPADQRTTIAPTTTVAPRRETGAFEPRSPGVTYTVPDGWENTSIGVVKPDRTIGMTLINAEDIFYTDYCRSTREIGSPVGPTVDDLASAWANLPGVVATAASDITVGGFDGKQIELNLPDYGLEDCSGMFFRCSFRGGDPSRALRCENLVSSPVYSNDNYQAQPGQHEKIWILEVHGNRLMIIAWSSPDASQQDLAALDEIVASIQIL